MIGPEAKAAPLSQQQVLVVGAIGLALFAALMGVMMQAPDAHARTFAFLDRYIDAVPWTTVLMAAPFMVLGTLAVLRRPVFLVYGLAALLPLNLVGAGGESRILALGKMLVNFLFVAALATVAVTPREWRRWLGESGIGWWLCAFCGCLVFSAIQGFFAGYDPYEWMREFGWLAFYAFAIPVGIFVRTREQLRIVIGLLILGAVVTLLVSLMFVTTSPRFERAEDWSGGSTFIRAPFSEGMRFVLLWAIASLFVAPHRSLRHWRTLALVTLALVLGIGVLASLGRSLWLSTFVGLSVVIALAPHDRRTSVLVLVSLVGAAVAVAGIEFLDRLSPFSSGQWLSDAFAFVGTLFKGQSVSSTIGREVEWRNAIRLWLDSPFIGNGIGAPFERTIYSDWTLATFYTHNSYLNILAKTGVVGFAALSALVINVFRVLRRVLQSENRPAAERALAAAMTAYLVGVLLHSFGAPAITTSDSVMFFALVIGLASVLGRLVEAMEPSADATDAALMDSR